MRRRLASSEGEMEAMRKAMADAGQGAAAEMAKKERALQQQIEDQQVRGRPPRGGLLFVR